MAEDSKMDIIEEFKNFNKELEEKILEANNDESLVKWNKLLPEFMGAEVFIAGQPTDQVNANGENIINILMMQKDGRTLVPFFTSPERVNAIANSQTNALNIMKINTVRFFQSVAGKASVLNPMSPYSRLFTPFDMRVLAAENIDKAPPLPENLREPSQE